MGAREIFISLIKTVNEVKLYFKQDMLNNFEYYEEYTEEYSAENLSIQLLHKKMSDLYVSFLNTERTDDDMEWFNRYFSMHYEGRYTLDSFLDDFYDWMHKVDNCLNIRKELVDALSSGEEEE